MLVPGHAQRDPTVFFGDTNLAIRPFSSQNANLESWATTGSQSNVTKSSKYKNELEQT